LPLDGNPNALVSGSETFSNGILNADIGYAVFGPGVFTSSAVGGMFDNPQLGGFDPVNDYVYAYHIANSGFTPVSSLQVSLALGGFFTDLGEDPAADPTASPPRSSRQSAPARPLTYSSPPMPAVWARSIQARAAACSG
jgi:hypothetical protein